jgi:hypothetical protein
MGHDGLSMELNETARKESVLQTVCRLIHEVRDALKHRDSTKNKIFVLLSIGIAGLINVNKVHKKKKNSREEGNLPMSLDERSPTQPWPLSYMFAILSMVYLHEYF